MVPPRFRIPLLMPHTPHRILWAWLALALLAWLGLPWYALSEGQGLAHLHQVFAAPETGSGLAQALQFGRPWLWVVPVAGAVAALGLLMPAGRRQGAWLMAGGLLGLVGVLGSGFLIGARGWAFESLNAFWGELASRQGGMGWGGTVTLVALLVLAAFGAARRGTFRGDLFTAAAVWVSGGLLLLFIAFPVLKALSAALLSEDGALAPLLLWERIANERNFGLACLTGGTRCGVAWNTLFLGLFTATTTTLLGTFMALMAERGNRRLAPAFNVAALLPIITPPFVVGLGLILLFGRAGLVNQFLEYAFDLTPSRWFYGWFGVWVAQTFAFTPVAFMIMRGVVQGISPSLEEAAQTLRADTRKTFFTITLPLLKPGLAKAFLVGFIESMADFGNPIVVGGQFSVLSTEIFFAIVGAQYDQGRAAALAWILTGFALVVFGIQHKFLGRQNFTTVSGKGDAGLPLPLPRGVSRVVHGVALPWMGFTLVVYVLAFVGGFVATWGRDYTFTFKHFLTAFALDWGPFGLVWAGTAWSSFFTTIKLAAIAAPLTAALGLLIAWLMSRTEFRGRGLFEFSALLAFAIPGTVLGVSYILAFNVPPFELTGTAVVIVLCFLFRNLPVGVQAGTAAFKQLDKSLDEASLMLRAGNLRTLRHVVLPLLKPALVAALIYSFVRAITTVSAVIFLVTAEYELATTYIIGRVGNGDYGVALAYCTVLILLMSLATGLIQWLVGQRRLGRRAAPPSAAAPVAAPSTSA